MNSEKVLELFRNHVPLAAVDACFALWQKHGFVFKLRKARMTKVGDFTFRPGQTPQITINQDLHPYLFLMTYIHEVAHHEVHLQHAHRAEAHGAEWKATFQQLMAPLLDPIIFPEPLLTGLKKHMANPKASSFSDTELTRLLRLFDERIVTQILLSDIPIGSIFKLNNRWFKKGEIRRTRVLCVELKSKRKYLVPADAPISETQLSLL